MGLPSRGPRRLIGRWKLNGVRVQIRGDGACGVDSGINVQACDAMHAAKLSEGVRGFVATRDTQGRGV